MTYKLFINLIGCIGYGFLLSVDWKIAVGVFCVTVFLGEKDK